jgi:pilus assembly protein Flp/PilA
MRNANRTMRRAMAAASRFATDRSGATAIEYGLIASLIFLAIVGSLAATGGGVSDAWTAMANKAVAAMTGK